MTKRADELGTMDNVLSPAYKAHMERTIGQGVCPFCNPDPKVNVLIREGTYWMAWPNPFPYPHHRHHIILATKMHCTEIDEVTPRMWAELGTFIASICDEFDIAGGGIAMRFGDPKLSASSLHHLHAHIQVPDLSGPAMAIFCKTGMQIPVGD
jgi:diadenosine tetraphosphate (Ap4A) HIT family hydrolase